MVPDDAWICLMCKEYGKAVGECIIKVPPRTTSNTHSHLNNMHGEAVAKIKKTTAENKKHKVSDSKKSGRNQSSSQLLRQ